VQCCKRSAALICYSTVGSAAPTNPCARSSRPFCGRASLHGKGACIAEFMRARLMTCERHFCARPQWFSLVFLYREVTACACAVKPKFSSCQLRVASSVATLVAKTNAPACVHGGWRFGGALHQSFCAAPLLQARLATPAACADLCAATLVQAPQWQSRVPCGCSFRGL
jgi:hypothetical protein